MTLPERERLLARVRQVRRRVAAREQADGQPGGPQASGDDPESVLARLSALDARVAHLERLLEGLQDSVHRESERHRVLIAELQAQVQPAAMGAALAENARKRGL
jgi:hypothetical protein